jgi:ribosome-binding factor A
MAVLHDARAELQHDLAKRVILKYTPQLHFKLDESIERGARVLHILDQLDPPHTSEDERPA